MFMRETYAVEGWRTDEDDEYESYHQAVDRFDALVKQAEVGGWHVEHGWASRDNLLAARLMRSHTDETYLEIVRVDLDDDCEADDQ
jgi:gamma-glutamyl:cysteine ligase YbdK (ATP-grasp superfamily)